MVRARPDRGAVDAEFDAFYRREIVSLRTLASALTGSLETGADLAHEAMLRAFGSWSRVSALDRPGAWVRRVLLNLATDTHRRRVREIRALDRVTAAPADSGTAEPGNTEFWGALRALPERQRLAAALYYVDDLSVDSIAAILDMSAGTVKSALFDARRALARTLATDDQLEVRGADD
jgi:RNA polymerase sigma-70 factor, ECF subfamily